MSTHTLSSFDTLQYVKRLKAADVPEKQAEAQAEALREALTDQFVAHTESSIRVVEQFDTRTQGFLATFEKKVEQRFAKVDQEFGKTEQRFARIDEEFAKIEQRFVRIDEEFAKIEKRFAKVDQEFAEIEQKFAKIDVNFAQVHGDIKLLKWMLGTLVGGVAALLFKAYL